MASFEQHTKRILAWSIGGCIMVPAVVVSAAVGIDQVRTWHACSRFATLAPADQVRRLQQAADQRDRRFTEVVRATLQTATDRTVVQLAGCAAMRIGAIDLLPLVQKRADEGPDDSPRAELIQYAARLSERDARLYDWLMQGTKSDQPWRHAGSAVGMLYLGRIESGPLLVAIARDGPPGTQALAMRHLAWVTRSIGQAIGQPMPSLDVTPPPLDRATIDQIDQFWQKHVTVSLLNDVLCRLTLRDPDWAEMARLIHARDRVAKYLQ